MPANAGTHWGRDALQGSGPRRSPG